MAFDFNFLSNTGGCNSVGARAIVLGVEGATSTADIHLVAR